MLTVLWVTVTVKDLKLSYCNKETLIVIISPHTLICQLELSASTATQFWYCHSSCSEFRKYAALHLAKTKAQG